MIISAGLQKSLGNRFGKFLKISSCGRFLRSVPAAPGVWSGRPTGPLVGKDKSLGKSPRDRNLPGKTRAPLANPFSTGKLAESPWLLDSPGRLRTAISLTLTENGESKDSQESSLPYSAIPLFPSRRTRTPVIWPYGIVAECTPPSLVVLLTIPRPHRRST